MEPGIIQYHKPCIRGPRCYVCGEPGGRYRRFVGGGVYAVIKCGECGLEYTDPIPTEAELRLFYEQYDDIRADRRIVELNARNHLKLLKKHGWTPELLTLDFGCGEGIFVGAAGDKCYGIDFKPASSPRIKQSLGVFGDMTWDCVTLWGVLEHLTNPKKYILDLARCLKMSGLLALTTVDAEGTIPYYYKPPEHLSYWTRRTFDVLAGQAGLQIIEYKSYYMSQIGEIYLERLLSRTPQEIRQCLSSDLAEIVSVPTNEVRVLMRKVAKSQ